MCSRKSNDALVDTAALRQKIQQKMKETQRGGTHLISRKGAHQGSKAETQPIIIDSVALHPSEASGLRGSPVSGSSDIPRQPSSLEAQQNKVQAAHAKKLLQAITPPKAWPAEKEGNKRLSKEKTVRKGFG